MDSFPHCQVCKRRFSVQGPEPLLLPCLHAVCDTCVTPAVGGTISCSTCLRGFNLGETTLEKDVVRKRQIFQLTAQHCPTEILCTHDDDGNQAQCWCTECEVLLCEHCRQLHDSFKGSRKHRSIKVSDMKPGDFVTEEVCRFHPEQPTCFWDRTCKCLICTLCKVGDHANHDVCGIDAAADTIRVGLKTERQKVGRLATSHFEHLEKGKRHLQSIDESSREVTNKVHDTLQAVHIGLEQREKELKISLQNQSDKSRERIQTKNKFYSSGYEACKVSSEYIQTALQCCSEVDILSLSALKETVHANLTKRSYAENDDICPSFTFRSDKLDRLRSELPSYGEVLTWQGSKTFEPIKKEVTTQTDINLTGIQELNHNAEQLPRANETIAELRENVKGLKNKNKSVYQQMKKKDKQLTEANESIEDLKERVQEIETEKTKVEEQLQCEEKKVITAEKTAEHAKAHVKGQQRRASKLSDEKKKLERQYSEKCEEITPFFTSHLQKEGVYLLNPDILNKSNWIVCTNLTLDRIMVNIEETHINTDGWLCNKPDPAPGETNKKRFVNYDGTTTISPLPLCGSPLYWEVEAEVGLTEALNESNLLLEVAMCREKERDKSHCVGYKSNSYSLTVNHCDVHDSVCREVCQADKKTICLPHTLPNIPGHRCTLSYGIVFDDVRGRVSFIDVSENKVIAKLTEIDFSQPLWPMLGVYNPCKDVKLRLVVGRDVVISDKKKNLITESLT